jgi:hypothetical protein
LNQENERQPGAYLPPWSVAELPQPTPPTLRGWKKLLGPSVVMMGTQIGGGEWLFGPEVTARYGGSLLWIATIAIVLQVYYNLECARYALYCGEPILTGFFRTRPGPALWSGVFAFFSLGFLIPGLSTQAAAVFVAILRDRPPTEDDRALVMSIAYVMLGGVVLPVLFGGKVYNMLQAVMTAKVLTILGFTTVLGLLTVSYGNWWSILSGFFQFGAVPVVLDGREQAVNAYGYFLREGKWPVISLANIAVLGAFAGYAGGGGLSNSTYSNYVRDKGWGMGAHVGAIPSAVGGKQITLSHIGKVFPIDGENLSRWRGWWRTIVVDQVLIWMPGCFIGMAMPALLSLEFAPHSPLYTQPAKLDWTQAVITADGLRNAPGFATPLAHFLWFAMLVVGLIVLLPSQMSIVDDFSRRWTDAIWSANAKVRSRLKGQQVRRIYYALLATYALWSVIALYLFSKYGTPKLMTVIIANLNNLVLGVTAVFILRINMRLLPKELRPPLPHRIGMIACSTFYLGLSALVFFEKQLPILRELLGV